MAKKKKKSPTSLKSDAEQFFYDNAGWGYTPGKETKEQGRRRGAILLAKAEEIASRLGWKAEWEHDQEPYEMGDAETEMPAEVLSCLLNDENGKVIGSLGGIGTSGNLRQDRNYGRVVEAELALEAASQKGLL